VHVDPRYTRTSAVADLHVALRAGTDVAFLGGLIRARASPHRGDRGLQRTVSSSLERNRHGKCEDRW
jgi:anaerobic selenocysteine-containing dehydrogenase